MATFEKFTKVARLTVEDKTSGKRMKEIFDVLRKYHVASGLTPEKLVNILEALGPTFVKIGQIASVRSDILPQEYCDALAKLTTEVAPMPYETVLEQLDSAYGHSWQETFLAIDPTPLGSASIAQVHKAVLLDGAVVAVKIRRPGIVTEMAEDITLMRHILATAEFVTKSHETELLNFESILDELERTTNQELNFDTELNNLIRFHMELADQEGVSSPIPYPAISNESVLVMEYVEGINLTSKQALVRAGYDPNELADRMLKSYITQVIDNGFFHADPHAGNILVRNGEIVWIDLGMVGTLNSAQRTLVLDMFQSVVMNDPYELMQAVEGISKETSDFDHSLLLSQLTLVIEKYGSADFSEVDMGDLLFELVNILRSHNLIVIPAVTMLVRGVVTIEGVVEKISPSTNVMKVVSAKVMRQYADPAHLEKSALQFAAASANSLQAMSKLPSQVSHALEMLDRGELSVKGDVKIPANALATIYASVGRLALALISAGLFLGSSILCATNMEPRILEVPVLGALGFLGALVLGVYVIVQVFRSARKMRKNGTDIDG